MYENILKCMIAAGEDGTVKMWSRNGMLRSVLVQAGRAAYSADWNPQSNKVAYCSGEECFIKMLKAQVILLVLVYVKYYLSDF